MSHPRPTLTLIDPDRRYHQPHEPWQVIPAKLIARRSDGRDVTAYTLGSNVVIDFDTSTAPGDFGYHRPLTGTEISGLYIALAESLTEPLTAQARGVFFDLAEFCGAMTTLLQHAAEGRHVDAARSAHAIGKLMKELDPSMDETVRDVARVGAGMIGRVIGGANHQ